MTKPPQRPLEQPTTEPPAARFRAWHYLALLVPYVALLVPAIYARTSPELFGIPFFYVYQFAWVFLSAGITALVYRSITR